MRVAKVFKMRKWEVHLVEIIYLIKIKNGKLIVNHGEYLKNGAHWIALYKRVGNFCYFVSFGAEHSSIETKRFTGYSVVYLRLL